MNAEEYMRFLEGSHSVVSSMTTVKNQFEDAGWDSHESQAATIMIFNNIMQQDSIKLAGQSTGRRFSRKDKK